MKRFSIIARGVALSCAISISFLGCGGKEDEALESTDSAAAAGEPAKPSAPAKPAPPPPPNEVTLAKKWPAGQTAKFTRSVKVDTTPTASGGRSSTQDRATSFSIQFGASGASLAGNAPMQITGQKFAIISGGTPLVSFDASTSAGGGGEDGGDMAEDPGVGGEDPNGGGGGGAAAAMAPLTGALQNSLGNTVQLTFNDLGAVSAVGGLQALHGKVFAGVPRQMFGLIGGMFAQTVFQEAPAFHSALNGNLIKKDASWTSTEKATILLNWQQDLTLTNTLVGFETWQGKQVAAINIAGTIAGTITRPSRVTIQPGGTITGKALYSPELGIVVQRNLTGSFSAQMPQGGVSNSFTQVFSVTSLGTGGGGEGDAAFGDASAMTPDQ